MFLIIFTNNILLAVSGKDYLHFKHTYFYLKKFHSKNHGNGNSKKTCKQESCC